jgi:hypothetical protein
MNASSRRLGWIAAVMVVIAAVPACSSDTYVFIGQDCPYGICQESGDFGTADAGSETAAAPVAPMCPVTTCPYPRTTCSSSEYACDVDLLRDNENCGACGSRCGDGPSSNWRCVDGKCTFSCGAVSEESPYPMRNCDGDPNNGCETSVWLDPMNCGECGHACAPDERCFVGECASACSLRGQPDDCTGTCTNLSRADDNCGTCGTVCDPTGPDKPALPSDMYYGCENYKCGAPKCIDGTKRNCNDDLSDGCEATLHTNEHCGSCEDVCAPGKECVLFNKGYYGCACEDDAETLCGMECVRLDTDVQHCGGCARICPGFYQPHFVATCNDGVCGGECEPGYSDCDGLPVNGCEINTRNDNRHCGACGNACQAGQVCGDGKCLVGPCEDGSEGPAQ